jgi:hypothetical protein
MLIHPWPESPNPEKRIAGYENVAAAGGEPSYVLWLRLEAET